MDNVGDIVRNKRIENLVVGLQILEDGIKEYKKTAKSTIANILTLSIYGKVAKGLKKRTDKRKLKWIGEKREQITKIKGKGLTKKEEDSAEKVIEEVEKKLPTLKM